MESEKHCSDCGEKLGIYVLETSLGTEEPKKEQWTFCKRCKVYDRVM